ncbi:MAG: Asp-tRNA(Asn)/Glu-tRNA(Gln) amidotransferase subunit GatB [bacterium]|nr:Asp-tRNA(Asn)/Glu-tRNA(Gln) amidotransferase subunit GatB [bacterium]
MDYEAVIGLEVHAQLSTNSKLFCSCSTKFGAFSNSQVCPVCLGLPGVLPVLNKKALSYALAAALAINCEIPKISRFSRKNYFYPDLPKAYQISQYDEPLAKNGYLEIFLSKDTVKRIGINRVHMEEDAGKLIHCENEDSSLVDYNRCGVPLIEIVSEPEINSSEEAYEYLMSLKSILEYLEVCDCNMEEGSLRCDANVSIRLRGENKLGTKAEIKNMNTFKGVQKALEYEIRRQINLVEEGEEVAQETRLWDADRQITLSMRSKEGSSDYRYFPEPDLSPVIVTEQLKEQVLNNMPELPLARFRRLMEECGIPEYDTNIIVKDRKLADYYEECVKLYSKPKVISNWIISELLGLLSKNKEEIDQIKITPLQLAEMFKLIDKGIISGKIAKELFVLMYESGKDPLVLVEEKNLRQVTDQDSIDTVVEKVLKEHCQVVEDIRNGKEKALGFLVGQVMRETKGKANPKIVNDSLLKKIKG